ncbi:hypothetical protein WMF31_08200 [Sorangium sp. So ce1036]|uniref:hypothetical protein n=1 Tax=Sorangium sp. So ce1036 TaxID=3133328 RepID=UPI003F0C48F1
MSEPQIQDGATPTVSGPTMTTSPSKVILPSSSSKGLYRTDQRQQDDSGGLGGGGGPSGSA